MMCDACWGDFFLLVSGTRAPVALSQTCKPDHHHLHHHHLHHHQAKTEPNQAYTTSIAAITAITSTSSTEPNQTGASWHGTDQ